MSELRPPRYSTVMPYRALNAAGIASRTCGSEGAMMTTLPSFLASTTSLSQPGAVDCAQAWVSAPAMQKAKVSAKARYFFILSSHQLLHAEPDPFPGVEDEIPVIA